MPPRVLMYHGFGRRTADADPDNLFVPAEELERQLRVLRRRFHPLDLDGYLRGLAGGRWPSRSVLVTMDDGYVSTVEEAAPLLARYGIPAVAFVCPGLLGGTASWLRAAPDEPLMSPEQVRSLAALGIEAGVHGMDHTLLPGLGPEELRLQVADAARVLEEVAGFRPRAFSYPEGRFDEAAVRAVKEAGYEVGFSVLEDAGRYGVPRIPINTRDSAATFSFKLFPGFLPMYRATAGRRAVRRAAAWVLRQRPAAR